MSEIPSGKSVLIQSRTTRESNLFRGDVDIRYEKHRHPTHYSIKRFEGKNPLPSEVRVGTEAYINKLWDQLQKQDALRK